MVEWSELDDDLLVEIVKRIKLYEDFVRFSGVCCSWRAAAIPENFVYAYAQIPWLMLPQKACNNHNFLNVSTGKKRRVFLPEANGKRCFSSKGWLLTVAQDLSLSLLHPFSRTQIKLPHTKSFENSVDGSTQDRMAFFIAKFALSASPSSTSNYTLMILYGALRRLGYYKAGDKSWTTIEEWHGLYMDVAYYKGQFYAMTCRGKIVACDFRGGGAAVGTTTVIASSPEHVQQSHPTYIIESGGSLMVVARHVKEGWGKSTSQRFYQTCGFKVFHVDLDTNTWTEVKDLGGRALFLGFNSSFSLEASDSFGTKPNCIYFTDDFWIYYWRYHNWPNHKGGGMDMGIYNIKDGRIDFQFWGNLWDGINPLMWV